jgi:probable rRNA maturation factor
MEREIAVLVDDGRLALAEAGVRRCVEALEEAGEWPVPAGDLVVRFVQEDECRRLHEAFYGDGEWTDVMTFPGDAEDGHAGDLAICPAYAATEAEQRGEAFAEELTLYLVHGWLHLAGLRDGTEEEAAEMRRAEAGLLETLRRAGAILPAEWTAGG